MGLPSPSPGDGSPDNDQPPQAPGAMRIYEAETEALLASQTGDPLLRHLTRTILDLARHYRPPAAGVRAIDIGCGVGRTSLALAAAGYEVLGLDPSERVVDLARRLAAEAGLAARFELADATRPPAPDWLAAFDLALSSEVIEHVEAPERVLAFAHQVLSPGGHLILTTPHDPAQWTVMDGYAGHVQRFGSSQLRGLLADFEVLELATEGFPFQRTVMALYDRRARRAGYHHDFSQYGDSVGYRLYTRLMPLLLRLDHALRGLGRGTTLVAVARKPAG